MYQMICSLLLLGVLAPVADAAADLRRDGSEAPPTCVILLHGLGRRAASMAPMADYLQARGYRVYNTAYPSTEASVETLTATYLQPVVKRCRQTGGNVIHMVGHSLGALMIRQYLQTHSLPNGSRIVMLAPPNKGSEVADTLGPWFFYRWTLGPAGQQLGTTADSLPNRLSPVDGTIGVITGNESWNLILSLIIPGPDDGKVSVERAKLDGMHDFIVLPVTHTFIMQDTETMRQTAHFLAYGRFDHTRSDEAAKDPGESARKVYRRFER
ncbi:MAG: alpha/beta fold hydrolase [Desulfobacterales bacterium]|nr:alpha/beta fold hydrolase [Desulfobacterales bacterium]